MTRNRAKRTRSGPLAEINVVPYIDVMLVLLVIFMITAPLLTQGINVNLPQARSKSIPPTKDLPVVVSVDSLGRYFLNVAPHPQQSIGEKELFYRVAATLQIAKQDHKIQPVYVKGDARVDYGKVVKAMALLQRAGADHVGLITQPQ